MRKLSELLTGIGVIAMALAPVAARADQEAICESLKHLAKGEYRDQVALAEQQLKSPVMVLNEKALHGFVSRLTPDHLNYLEAARTQQIGNFRVQRALNEEVSLPALREISYPNTKIYTEFYSLEVVVSKTAKDDILFLQACSRVSSCVRLNLFDGPDFDKAIQRAMRLAARYPSQTEEEYVKSSIPEYCSIPEPKSLAAEKVESDSSSKNTPAASGGKSGASSDRRKPGSTSIQ